jgi:hypothetical protein
MAVRGKLSTVVEYDQLRLATALDHRRQLAGHLSALLSVPYGRGSN